MISQNQEILKSFNIGFEFEFFTELKEKKLVESLRSYLQKSIVVPRVITGHNRVEKKVHTKEVVPTCNSFKLEKDYSGGADMWELITGPMCYQEARIILIRMYQWLINHGSTNDRCSNHINISLDKTKSRLNNSIISMDRLKFCLSFKESEVYKNYPKRRDNVYAQSMKLIYPNNKFVFNDNFNFIFSNNYKVPTEKYYGVNFLKQEKDYLEFRYIGGKDYEKKVNIALKTIDFYCLSIYNILANPEFNESDVNQLKKIVSNHKKTVKGFSTLENFIYNYPNIRILVDLKGERETLKMFWNKIRDRLYDLIIFGKMEKGIINYDSDIGKFQIKNTKLIDCLNFGDFDIINSDIDGLLHNCEFYDCTINNSQLKDCNFVRGNLTVSSKIESSTIGFKNKFIDCYIDNKKNIINGTYVRCIIRSGDISTLAIIDEETLIVDGDAPVGKKEK